MNRAESAQDMEARFSSVCQRLARAVERAGRNPGDVRLVAVSKRHPAEAVARLARYWQKLPGAPAGPVFGESYVQEALAKQDEAGDLLVRDGAASPEWHFIGHLQSRKARDVVGRFGLIHSVDSLKLARQLQAAWESRVLTRPVGLHESAPAPQAVLVQVNIGGEEQKSGVAPSELEELLTALCAMTGLDVQGLMCLPPFLDDPAEVRPHFAALRALAERMRAATGLALPQLSMGMSHDFEAAVAEGATLVRVGTDIFGPRPA